MVELIQRIKPGIIKQLVDIETNNFGGDAGLNEWTLVPLIRHGRVFVYWHEDKPVGLCQYMRDWEQPWKAYLVGISINAQVRNRGYGTSLLRESFSYLASENVREVELTVSPGNLEAIVLYQEKLGFMVVDFWEHEYGPGQHRVVMSRLI